MAGDGSYRSSTVGVPAALAECPAGNRQQPFDDNTLLHHRLELVVDEMHAVDLALDERVDGNGGHRLGVGKLERGKQVDLLVAHLEPAAGEIVAAAAADEPEHHFAIAVLGDERRRRLDDVRVEAAAQSAVGGDHEEQRAAARLLLADARRVADGPTDRRATPGC